MTSKNEVVEVKEESGKRSFKMHVKIKLGARATEKGSANGEYQGHGDTLAELKKNVEGAESIFREQLNQWFRDQIKPRGM